MTSSERTETTLDKARQGDRSAFDAVIEACRVELEGHIQRRVGASLRAHVECEDVLQETCKRAWKGIATFRGRNSRALFAWLKTIAERSIVDFANRHRHANAEVIYLPEFQEPSQAESSPSRVLRREERFARLREALDSLSPDHRQVVLLVRIQGLRIREAAERMNRTPNAVMKLLTRALEKLKEAFGDTESLHLPPARLDGEDEGST